MRWARVSAPRLPDVRLRATDPRTCAMRVPRSSKVDRQRAVMSRVPQSTQKVRPCRRATACLEPSHCVVRRPAFTTPPHCGQWLTGASRRRWFMFSQVVPELDPITLP